VHGKKGQPLKGAALTAALKKRKAEDPDEATKSTVDGNEKATKSAGDGDGDTTDSAAAPQGTPSKKSRRGLKKGEGLAQPREPSRHLLSFNTEKYRQYNFG
jgi:hypothetical protein